MVLSANNFQKDQLAKIKALDIWKVLKRPTIGLASYRADM